MTISHPFPMEKHIKQRKRCWQRQYILVILMVFALMRHLLVLWQVSLSLATIPTGYAETFQVHQPILNTDKNCSVVVMDHSFANSWGQPFVGDVDVPACGTDFTGVVMEMTVFGKGRQYDRLGFVFVGDTEVWRTSTLEPSNNGTYSITSKTVTKYSSLFKVPWKLIVDIGNTVDQTYVSPFNVTLKVIYQYGGPAVDRLAQPADLIYPLSHKVSSTGKASVFSLPNDKATSSVTIPQNIRKATVEVYASGNADEEFWYSNVPSRYANLNPDLKMLGGGAFREVQVLIDGVIAGLVWPFAVVYTGGLSPALWRPIVAIDAFDQMTYTIDVTPFLGILCDGKSHDVSFNVVGPETTILQNWFISGNLQVWKSGGVVATSAEPMVYSITETRVSTDFDNHDQSQPVFQTRAARSLSISTKIYVDEFITNPVVNWTQNLHFENTQRLLNKGIEMHLTQKTFGTNSAGYKGSIQTIKQDTAETTKFSYPFAANTSFILGPKPDEFYIFASIDHSKSVESTVLQDPYVEYTRQAGVSTLQRTIENGVSTSKGSGITAQEFTFARPGLPTYKRSVSAKGGELGAEMLDAVLQEVHSSVAATSRDRGGDEEFGDFAVRWPRLVK